MIYSGNQLTESNLTDDRINYIRESEKKSHTDMYTTTELFEKGTWLSKPIKTVTDLFPFFDDRKKFRGLDLGCGIGRNCIPLAQYLRNIDCKIDCVDILDLAVTQLEECSKDYNVSTCINGVIMPLEEYDMKSNYYDLVLAISSLEHVWNEDVFYGMLLKIKDAVCQNGIICFVINSDVTEIDSVTQQKLAPSFEVNLPTEKLVEHLEKIYCDWEIMKSTVNVQRYDIPRENLLHLSSNVVTWVARKA